MKFKGNFNNDVFIDTFEGNLKYKKCIIVNNKNELCSRIQFLETNTMTNYNAADQVRITIIKKVVDPTENNQKESQRTSYKYLWSPVK